MLQSEMRMFLEPLAATPVQFWLGTGVHFALEDLHGYKKFDNVHDAFDAYMYATYKDKSLMPEAFQESYKLGHGMLDNYMEWLPGLRGFETLWIDGVPMCEVRLLLPMPEIGEGVEYSATIDRILKDEHGRIWLLDYKTAKTINTEKLPLDTQITSYHWAVKRQYGLEVEGMIYIQMLKSIPDAPKEIRNGAAFSQAKGQATTYNAYRKALLAKFGKVPEEYKEYLQYLKGQQGFLDNKYVKVDFVRRNSHQIAAEEKKIIAEGREMINPELPMYPNPTKDCSWDCSFKQVCVAVDDGSDYRQMIKDNFRRQLPGDDKWRDRIVWPSNQELSPEEVVQAGKEWLE